MRILFMGTPLYATNILKKIIEDDCFEIVGVVTQPDKPVGRKQALTPPHIKDFLINNHSDIKIFQPTTLRDLSVKKIISELKPDFIIVAAYGKILPKDILDIAPCINLHASLLPLYRGASPVQFSIKDDVSFYGVTAMLMNEGLDTGDMLAFSYCSHKDITSSDLLDILSKDAGLLIVDVLKNFENINPIKQVDSDSTLTSKITKDMGLIDFSMNAKTIMQIYLAFEYWPGIFISSGLKIRKVSFVKSLHNNHLGSIVEVDKDSISVACRDSFLYIKEVQSPSKQWMNAADYIRGARLGCGDILV